MNRRRWLFASGIIALWIALPVACGPPELFIGMLDRDSETGPLPDGTTDGRNSDPDAWHFDADGAEDAKDAGGDKSDSASDAATAPDGSWGWDSATDAEDDAPGADFDGGDGDDASDAGSSVDAESDL